MRREIFDVLVIGGGSAGLAAAAAVAKRGRSVVIIERETVQGGILNQCIHNGFGLQRFEEELTGPEYAERYISMVTNLPVSVYTGMTVTSIDSGPEVKRVYGFSSEHGMVEFTAGAVVLAMGCRERNRGNIGTPGTRPAGIFTAGLAQRLVNIDGYVPGKKCVIVGSGDIGLIMARRMTWVGAEVSGVVEIQPYPAGLTRNIVQCLHDFTIPLYLSHVVSRIYGKDRVEGVDITPLKRGKEDRENSFYVECDTLLLSVGLVPDNEVSKTCGIEINPETNGPFVDADLMTGVEGIFACGNVLHVHDLVDYVSEEATRCGGYVCDYLERKQARKCFSVNIGGNVKYVVPNSYTTDRENRFYLRSMIVSNGANLTVTAGGVELLKKRLRHVQPSEMISFTLGVNELAKIDTFSDNSLTVGIEREER